MTYADGSVYNGSWENDKEHGSGSYQYLTATYTMVHGLMIKKMDLVATTMSKVN